MRQVKTKIIGVLFHCGTCAKSFIDVVPDNAEKIEIKRYYHCHGLHMMTTLIFNTSKVIDEIDYERLCKYDMEAKK